LLPRIEAHQFGRFNAFPFSPLAEVAFSPLAGGEEAERRNCIADGFCHGQAGLSGKSVTALREERIRESKIETT
jgi:hypothetical protein